MRNKIQFLLFTALYTNCSYAQQSGIWLGLKGGYASGNAHIKRHLTEAVPGYQNTRDHSTMAIKGVNTEPFTEFSYLFDQKYYLAVQLSSSFSNIKGKLSSSVNNPNISLKNTLKLKNSYGSAIKLGISYKGNIYFLKGGFKNGGFQAVTDGLPFMGRTDVKKRLNGITLGIGMDIPFGKFSIGAAFAHTRFKPISYPMLDRQGVNILNSKIKPSLYEATIHIKYNFFNTIF